MSSLKIYKGSLLQQASLKLLYRSIGEAILYDYYVDSVNGNDSNTGLSPGQAFKTLSALGTVAGGTRIGLARGSHWRESLDISNANVVIGAYGSGILPLVDGSDIIPGESWTKTEAQTNIYQITLSGMSALGITLVGLNVWENDVQHTYYTSLAALDAAVVLPGYFVVNPGTATPTLYIHASGDDKNPATNGKVYEYAHRNNGIATPDATVGLQISNVWARRGYATGGCIRVGPQSTVINCVITDGNKYSMFIKDGCTVSGCIIKNGHHPTEATIIQLIYNQNSPSGIGITISNNTFGWSSASVPRFASCSVIGGHYNLSGNFGNISITGNTFTNAGYAGYVGTHAASLTFSGNTFTNVKFSYIFSDSVITLFDETVSSNITNTFFIGTSGVTTISVSQCVFSATGVSSQGYIFINSPCTITIEDCVFTTANNGNIPDVYCSSATANITLLRNAHNLTTNFAAFYTFTAGAVGMTWVSDYNTFNYLNTFRALIFGTTYSNFGLYQAAVTPNDANSTAG